jgi:signal transduction histidine kinase
LSLLAEDKKIVLTCEASQPAYVQGDRSRIKQVIVNLLDNAIKYTPPLGRVQMEVHGLNGRAVLEVEDSGVGIAPEALPHVFERFYRVDKARCADAESAGLGLAIVKAICAAHGAEVEAASTPGVGSRFRVKLPLQKGENLSSNHDLKKFNAVIF